MPKPKSRALPDRRRLERRLFCSQLNIRIGQLQSADPIFFS